MKNNNNDADAERAKTLLESIGPITQPIATRASISDAPRTHGPLFRTATKNCLNDLVRSRLTKQKSIEDKGMRLAQDVEGAGRTWPSGRQGRVRKLIQRHGIKVRGKRKFVVTTDSKHDLPIAESVGADGCSCERGDARSQAKDGAAPARRCKDSTASNSAASAMINTIPPFPV